MKTKSICQEAVVMKKNIYKNKKTGGLYLILRNNAICTTNAFDGERMVAYINLESVGNYESFLFVREYEEFMNKFESAGDINE